MELLKNTKTNIQSDDFESLTSQIEELKIVIKELSDMTTEQT